MSISSLRNLNQEIKREEERKAIDAIKGAIDSSNYRKVDTLQNGDRFVHDGNVGYEIDSATDKVKRWYLREAVYGGDKPRTWKEAEFSWDNVIGPGRNYVLIPKKPLVYR
ncbi:hypothetical protein HYV89_03255 [Candidatus Woesearchaeota archaeon]|nr:hypothetical protein [Candidatus Woesearchaeota archaeon]